MMGTRSGDLDPGVLLYLMNGKGYTAQQIEDLVNDQAGLLGVFGNQPGYADSPVRARAGSARRTGGRHVLLPCAQMRGGDGRDAWRSRHAGLHRRNRGESGVGACSGLRRSRPPRRNSRRRKKRRQFGPRFTPGKRLHSAHHTHQRRSGHRAPRLQADCAIAFGVRRHAAALSLPDWQRASSQAQFQPAMNR